MSSGNDNQRHPIGLGRRVFSLPTLISLSVALAFMFFLATRFDLDWGKTWDNVLHLNPWQYLTALALYYLSSVFRGLRWRLLAANAGIHDSPGATLPSALSLSQLIVIGWFVNSVAPLRLGDAYRAYAFSEVSGAGFSWSLGTILTERALDMLTVLMLIAVGIGWYSLTRDSSGTGRILLAALVMGVALGGVLAVMKGYGARLARLLPARLEAAYSRFQEGALGSLKRLPALFSLGLVGWLLEVARLFFVVQAMGLTISPALVLVAALGHAILSTVPTPGGVGAVEPGVTGLLVLEGMASHDALSVALVDRSITYLSIIVLGGLAFLAWRATHRRQPAGARGWGLGTGG